MKTFRENSSVCLCVVLTSLDDERKPVIRCFVLQSRGESREMAIKKHHYRLAIKLNIRPGEAVLVCVKEEASIPFNTDRKGT